MLPNTLFFKDYQILPASKTVVIYGQRLGSTILDMLGTQFPHAISHHNSNRLDLFLELMEDHEVAIIIRDPIARIRSGLTVHIPHAYHYHTDLEVPDETLARDDVIKFKSEMQKEINESKWHIKTSGLINYTLGDSHIDWATEVLFYFMLSLGKMPKLYWLQGWEANSVNSIDLPNMVDFGEDYFTQFPQVKFNLSMAYKSTGKPPGMFDERIHDQRILIYQQIFSNATPHRITNNKSRNNYVSNGDADAYVNAGMNQLPRNPDETFLTPDDIKFYSFNDYMSDWYKMFNTMVTIGQDVNFYKDKDRYSPERCKQIGRDMITDVYQNISTKMNLDWIQKNYWKPVPGQHFLNMIELFKHNPELFPQYKFK